MTGVARDSPAKGVDDFEVVETLHYASSCWGQAEVETNG